MVPQIHREFINRTVDYFKNDARIVGLGLGGSYISGQLDEYSDLDFVVAVNAASFDEVISERLQIPARLGSLLSCFTGEHVGVPNLVICLFDAPLLHVDLNFVTPEQKRRRIEDPVILFEKDGALSSVFKASKPVEPGNKNQWIEDRFWVWVHYTATKIGRGELFEAIDDVGFLRGNVLGPMIQAEKGIFPRGVRYLERDAPEHLQLLMETVPDYDVRHCIYALKASIRLYDRLRERSAVRIVRRTDAEKRALEYLNDIESSIK